MTNESSEYEMHLNKRTDRIYLSKALEQKTFQPDELTGIKEINRTFRIVSKVLIVSSLTNLSKMERNLFSE